LRRTSPDNIQTPAIQIVRKRANIHNSLQIGGLETALQRLQL
jgi:hypothetical protein